VEALDSLQWRLRDLLFLHEDGLRLGLREVSDEIILVVDDQKSHTERPGMSTIEEDLQLYERLLKAGARVVGDARLPVRPERKRLMQGLAALEDKGCVLRNIWYTYNQGRMVHVGVTLLDIEWTPAYDTAHNLRYYPMGAMVGPLHSRLDALAFGLLSRYLDIPYGTLPEGLNMPVIKRTSNRFGWITSGSIMINYAGPPGSFTRYSYIDVMEGRVPKGIFFNKVIIIDDSQVLLPTPTSNRWMIRGEIGANVLQSLIEGRFLREQAGYRIVLVMGLLSILIGVITVRFSLPISMASILGLLVVYIGYSTLLYRNGLLPDVLYTPGAFVLTAISSLTLQVRYLEIKRKRLRQLFSRYVQPNVVEELIRMDESQGLLLTGRRQPVTVCFVDIRGFTAYSLNRPPEEVVKILNEFLALGTKIIFEYKGTLDKFLGDGLMAVFNAPMPQPDHPVRAVKASLALVQKMKERGDGLPFNFSIGIHTGEAIVGNIGMQERMEYTSIGPVVNLASRLCDLAGPGEVVVSSELARLIEDHFVLEQKGPTQIKGIEGQILLFRVTGERDPF
jgi:class 3 adenylate cyclase